MNAKRKALGRGLSALLEDPATDITTKDLSGNNILGGIANIPVSKIKRNPFQPREDFDEEALQELSDSIKQQGIIQPITVRKMGYDKYQLISGERRLRASEMAGLKQIPAYIRVADDQQMLELALVENIQRKDLNPLEIAISYQRLIEECKLTQEKLSGRVGKNRTTITNYIRLLKLPPEIQLAIKIGKLTMGHARALINIEDQDSQYRIANEVIEQNLSVREAEKLAKDSHNQKKTNRPRNIPLPEKYKKAKEDIAAQLKTKVDIKRNNKGKGTIVIKFNSDEELDDLLKGLS
jgi:ParB family chromosome partitioning protein